LTIEKSGELRCRGSFELVQEIFVCEMEYLDAEFDRSLGVDAAGFAWDRTFAGVRVCQAPAELSVRISVVMLADVPL
jgi:hypothetical protein